MWVYHHAILDARYTLFNRVGKTHLFTQCCPKTVIDVTLTLLGGNFSVPLPFPGL